MYLLTIYFKGPRTAWAGKVCPEETIVSKAVPWLWLARQKARQLLADMVSANVAYAITDSHGVVLEPRDAPKAASAPRHSTIHGWPKHLKD